MKKIEILGKRFTNTKKNCIAEPLFEVKSNNKNKRYFCNIYNLEGELVEQKQIQRCGLIHGSFNLTSIFTDKAVYRIARPAYDHMKERLRTKKSYQNVNNCFDNFEDFYITIINYLEEYPQYYQAYINGHLEHDKDLKSFLLDIEKEYSERTLMLLSRQDNNAVRSIVSREMPHEEKRKLLLSIIDRVEN